MICLPRKPFVFENKELQKTFETLPTRNILKLDETRLIDLQNFANQLKTGLITRNKTYYRSNNTLKDYFTNAVRILYSVNNNKLVGYNFEFYNQEEIGLIIMLMSDSELKYLLEYKKNYLLTKDAEEARKRLEIVFGFYSPKLHAIELHYASLLNKLEKEKSMKLNKTKKGESIYG